MLNEANDVLNERVISACWSTRLPSAAWPPGLTGSPLPALVGPLGKQLLPLSSSLHGGVSQLWQVPAGGLAPPLGPGEGNNLVWMRNQTLGQSAPSLTGLVSPGAGCVLISAVDHTQTAAHSMTHM